MSLRQKILKHICYTDLVYGRVNKKLKTTMARDEIEKFVLELIACETNQIQKIGKNYYVRDERNGVSLTINSQTFRLITAGYDSTQQSKSKTFHKNSFK